MSVLHVRHEKPDILEYLILWYSIRKEKARGILLPPAYLGYRPHMPDTF